MEVNVCLNKFKVLLEKLFDENVECSQYYTHNILKYLNDQSGQSIGKKLLETPVFSDLILHYFKKIHGASTANKTFLMNVVTAVFENELQSDRLHNHGFCTASIGRCVLNNLNSNIPSPALHLACLKIVRSELMHRSGLNLLIENKMWEKVLRQPTHYITSEVYNEIYNLISMFVWKLNEYNEETTLIELIQYIFAPITKSEYFTLTEIDGEHEKVIANDIITYLHALHAIFSDMDQIIVPNKVVPLLREYIIEKKELGIHAIFAMTRLPNIATLISDILFKFYFATCLTSRRTMSYNDFCNKIISSFHNLLNRLLRKRMPPVVLSFIVKCNIIWSKFGRDIYPSRTFENNGQQFDVQNQFTLLLIVPLLGYAGKDHEKRQEFIEDFTVKLGKIGTEHIIKAGYSFRELNENGDKQKNAILTLRELFKLKGRLSETQAGIIFQSLYYLLVSYVTCDGAGGLILNQSPFTTPDDVKLLSLLLDAIKMLLKEHQIRWYENVEIISLQKDLMNLLKQNILPTKQIQQVVDLIDLTIRKFISPDLSLLVESKQGSTLNEIGAMMKSYIQHEDWEIRDSALTLLLSCTDVAFIKYIPLQKLIAENNLMTLASHAALSDPEYYPQCTALRCLAAATKITTIWRDVVAANRYIYVSRYKQRDMTRDSHVSFVQQYTQMLPLLQMQLFYILKQNTEGMVRKEVASVLTEIYINQTVSQNYEKCLYKMMTVAALDDLHWEVQLAALHFWKHSIRSHLTNRGMIDGKFPSMTFSKTKRKIIVLNEMEIEKQLTEILIDLSKTGCLTILHDCLKEDQNLAVMEQAYNMVKDLIDILNYYKFEKVQENAIIPENLHLEIKIEAEDSMDVCEHDEAVSDNVIDTIVNTKQSDLIEQLYENYVEKESNVTQADLLLATPKREYVHPNKFLENFKENDYSSIIEGKINWNSEATSLSMLLDEVLDLDINIDKPGYHE